MKEHILESADWPAEKHAREAIVEIVNSILERHPEATFEVEPGVDDPTAIHLKTFVDLDDAFVVLDEIIDRLVEIQVDDGIPLHVIPQRTPERALAAANAFAERRRNPYGLRSRRATP